MKTTKVLFLAWYFVAISNSIYQAITTIGPFSSKQACEEVAQQTRGSHRYLSDDFRTVGCWSFEEPSQSAEKEQSK